MKRIFIGIAVIIALYVGFNLAYSKGYEVGQHEAFSKASEVDRRFR